MHRHLNYFIAGSIALSMAACGDDVGPQVTPLEITTSTLQGGMEGADYQVEVTASGGSGEDYRWSLAEGGLPSGVFLRSEGTPTTVIAGRPRSGSTANFTLRVRDPDGNEGTKAFTIEITDAPAAVEITTTMLQDAEVLMPYTAEITAQNGEGYSWRLLGGQLPPGLTFGTDGTPSTTLSGTPPLGSEGRYSFTVQVEDSNGNRSDAQYSVEVLDTRPPLEVVPQSLTSANVGRPYTGSLVARFGSLADYRWELVSGELPPGLMLAAEGTPDAAITGTPTLRGSYAFRVEVTDSEGNTARQSFFIEVNPAPDPLRITTFEIPSGRVAIPYTTQLNAVNGSREGYMWSVASGMLPPGLMLSTTPDSPFAVTLSGTPTQDGAFDFVIQVEDSFGDLVTQPYSVVIGEQIFPVTITATSAVGGVLVLPNAEGGQPYAAVLRAEDGAPLPANATDADVRYNWVVTGGTLPPGLSLDVNGQGVDDVGTFTGVPTALGTFTATVTVFDRLNQTDTQIIRITVDPPAIPLTIDTVVAPPLASSGCDAISISASGGGNAGFQWEVASGSLPPGFVLGAMGTPNTTIAGASGVSTGTYNVTLRVTDTFGLTDTQDYTLTVDATKQGAPRWAVMVGDVDVSSQNDIYVTDMCNDPVQPPIRLNTVPTGGFHDVLTGSQRLALSPKNNALVFIADLDVDGRADVYFVDLRDTPTAGSAVRIYAGASTSLEAEEVEWSPDGRKVAILTDHTDSFDYELWVADVSNPSAPGQAVRVSPVGAPSRGVYNDDYEFSPDGNKIAWVGDHDVAFRDYIYVADLSGATPSAPVTVHATPSSTSMDVNGGMLWTSDSRGVVFNADFNTVSRDEMFFSDVSGAAPYSASVISGAIQSSGDMDPNFTQFYHEHFAFSPDGTKLFIVGDRVSEGEDDMFLLDYANGAFTNLRAVTQLTVNFATCDSGKWSPDGRYIAVRGDLRGSSQDELFVFDTQGTLPAATNQPIRAATTSLEMGFTFYEDYRWSPDSTKVAFIGDFQTSASDEIYIADITAGGPYTSHKLNPPTNSSVQDVNEMRFSPDSQRIAFQGDVRSSFDELYVADITTLPPAAAFTAHPRFSSTAFDVFQNNDGADNSWYWASDRTLLVRGDLVTSAFDAVYLLDVTGGSDLEPTLLAGPGQFMSTSAQDVFHLILR